MIAVSRFVSSCWELALLPSAAAYCLWAGIQLQRGQCINDLSSPLLAGASLFLFEWVILLIGLISCGGDRNSKKDDTPQHPNNRDKSAATTRKSVSIAQRCRAFWTSIVIYMLNALPYVNGLLLGCAAWLGIALFRNDLFVRVHRNEANVCDVTMYKGIAYPYLTSLAIIGLAAIVWGLTLCFVHCGCACNCALRSAGCMGIRVPPHALRDEGPNHNVYDVKDEVEQLDLLDKNTSVAGYVAVHY